MRSAHDGRLGTLMPGAEAIHSIKLNDVDPRAWLAHVLRTIADQPALRLDELLPWNYAKRAVKLPA